MEPLLAALNARCTTRTSAIRITVVAILLAAVAVAVGVVTDTVPVVPVVAGALAGALAFAAGYVFLVHDLPVDVAAKLNLRQRLTVPRRRWIVLWTAIGWLALLGFGGQYANSTVLIGAANVAVLLGLWHFGSRTATERAFDELLALADESMWSADELDDEDIPLSTDADGADDPDSNSARD